MNEQGEQMSEPMSPPSAFFPSRILAASAVLALVGVVFVSLRASRSQELASAHKDEATALLLAASQVAAGPSTDVAAREIQLARLEGIDPAAAMVFSALAEPDQAAERALPPVEHKHHSSHELDAGAKAAVGFDPIAQCEECLANRPFRYLPQQWTPELINQCLEVASSIDPDLGIQLAAKRGKSAEEQAAFLKELQHSAVGSRLLAMTQLKSRDPELYRTKISELSSAMQVRRFAVRLREAIQTGSEGQVDAMREQLRGMLRIQLALSIKARADYICKLDERIYAARQQLDHDVQHFQETVEEELQALTRVPVEATPAGHMTSDQ